MIIFDHQVLANSIDTALNGSIICKFAKYQRNNNFYNFIRFLGHQMLLNMDYIVLWEIIVGIDSYNCIYVGLLNFTRSIYPKNMSVVFATEK